MALEASAESLAKEIAAVCTVGLGRPLRSNAKSDQLVQVAKQLGSDETLPRLPLFEEVLTPSIERLGRGELGVLARMEFGLHPETKHLRFLSDRRGVASDHFGIGNDALKRLERQMHLALAEDLLTRVKAKEE